MDNVVKPKLIGKRADIHPMFVLVGVLGGATAFGFIGLFLGPLLMGVMIAVLKVYESDYLDPEVNLVDEMEFPSSGREARTRTPWRRQRRNRRVDTAWIRSPPNVPV